MTSFGEAPDDLTPNDLIDRLAAVLPDSLPSALRADGPDPTPGNDLYEAYLFSLVLKAVRREGFDVSFLDRSGNPPSIFQLRRSPGRICSGSFTHARLEVARKDPLEVHTGVYVTGRSGVAHEADVLVLDSQRAERCRRLGLDPRSSETLLLVEGKYHSRPVGLSTGREFLGLDSDVASKNKVLAATTGSQSFVYLLNGRSKFVEVGVLPGRKSERDVMERFAIVFRSYRQRLN